MYTQCPDCATVFRITADALRAAQGDVRCGICSTTFNALENLSELSFKATPAEDTPAPEDTITVEELPGNENIELSSPPDLAAVADPPASDPANEPGPDQSLEFHGTADDLDRVFVVEPGGPATFDPAQVAAALSIAERSANDDPRDADEPDGDRILVREEPFEADDFAAGESVVLQGESASSPFGPARILIPDEMRKRLAEEAAAASAALDPDFESAPAADAGRRWIWPAAVGLLLLLLIVQIAHAGREQLVRRAGIGPLMAQVYALLGMPLSIPTDLAAYELRQWGAASDPDEANRLLLRASIVNRAGYAQPYPLLRLSLQDRFGATLAWRDIEPPDYLPGSEAPGLLQPGERADALVRIVDPGKEAVGFEMDLCIAAAQGVRCANQAPARP